MVDSWFLLAVKYPRAGAREGLEDVWEEPFNPWVVLESETLREARKASQLEFLELEAIKVWVVALRYLWGYVEGAGVVRSVVGQCDLIPDCFLSFLRTLIFFMGPVKCSRSVAIRH